MTSAVRKNRDVIMFVKTEKKTIFIGITVEHS